MRIQLPHQDGILDVELGRRVVQPFTVDTLGPKGRILPADGFMCVVFPKDARGGDAGWVVNKFFKNKVVATQFLQTLKGDLTSLPFYTERRNY